MARLLRLRLLTLDASILLLPVGAAPQTGGETAAPARAAPRRAATGKRLSDAIRSIDEAEQGLARARHASRADGAREPAPRRAMTPSPT